MASTGSRAWRELSPRRGKLSTGAAVLLLAWLVALFPGVAEAQQGWVFSREPPFAFLTLDPGSGANLYLRCSREPASGRQIYIGFASVKERDRLTGARHDYTTEVVFASGSEQVSFTFQSDTSTADLFIDAIPERAVSFLQKADRLRVTLARSGRTLIEATGANNFAEGFRRFQRYCGGA